jgi:uncharacterized protein YkwD
MKIYTYCGILLLGALLVSISYSRPDGHGPALSVSNHVSDNQTTASQPVSADTSTATGIPDSTDPSELNGIPAPAGHSSSSGPSSSDPSSASDSASSSEHEISAGQSTSSPMPSQTPAERMSVLTIKGTSLTLGEDEESVIKKFGKPGRIVDTEYDFDYYVYNNDYKNLSFIAMKDGLVTGFYTDSLSLQYMGITPASDIGEVNRQFNSSYRLSEIITINDESVTAKLLMDAEGTGKVIGIYVLSNKVKEDGFTDSVLRSTELLTYDLTNSIRARNDIPVLSWSSSAAKAARKHSLDMAVSRYFDHVSPDGERPGDRLNEEGLTYQSIGENIIAGYGTAILSCHAWFNSPGHRENLLNPDYKCLGVGFTYQEDSKYKNYMTQEFYR